MPIECPVCRSNNPETQSFCGECGTRLETPGRRPEPETLPKNGLPRHGPLDPRARLSVTETLEASTGELERGTVFAGRYEIIETLGTGGMGRVYRAIDTKLEEEVALKLIKPEIAAERRAVERFRNEIRVARKITHRNVCRTHDLHEVGKTLFLTMEYVRGEDLKSLIRRTRALAVGTAVSIARQVADGLAEAHKLGIVHRDLKPGNIMIDKEGQAKIMDFGIARSLLGGGVTGEGAVVGTPDYMSPEQVEGKPADARSDIYSLAVILFEMIVGCPPFEGKTPFSVANMHRSEPPPAPKKLLPQIPEELNRLILRCLEKDKARRCRTAEEFAAELGAVEQALPAADRVLAQTRAKTRASREITVKFTLWKLMVPSVAAVGLIIFIIFAIKPSFKNKGIFPPPMENSFAIASFENQTGDKNQDNLQKIIPELLRAKFEQTGVAYIATLERMRDILKQVGKPDVDLIDSNLGIELARRDGVKALVVGSYSRSGDTFVTTLRVLDVATKRFLATASSAGAGPESVLSHQLDDLCEQVFSRLNFSMSQLEKAKTPITELTTSSMEAYSCYVQAIEAVPKWRYEDSVDLLERAVAIDPTFAVAYVQLSSVYFYLGESGKALGNLEKAERLAYRVSDKERFMIDWQIAFYKEHDLEQAIAIERIRLSKYPKEKNAYLVLALTSRFLGSNMEQIELLKQALEIDPSQTFIHFEIGVLYLWMKEYAKALEYAKKVFDKNSTMYLFLAWEVAFRTGKIDEALELARKNELAAVDEDKNSVRSMLAYMHALKEDLPEALRQVDLMIANATRQRAKFKGYALRSIYHIYSGKTARAASDLQAAEALVGNTATPDGSFDQALIKWLRFWMAYDQNRTGDLQDSIPDWPERAPQIFFSRTYFKFLSEWARGSRELLENRLDLAKAQELAMASSIPEMGDIHMFESISADKDRARYWNSVFRSEIWLREGALEKAIAELSRTAAPEPFGFQEINSLLICLTPFLNDTLARAYEQRGDIDKAISEYSRLLRIDPKIGPRSLPHPKYHYQLAALWERKGDKPKAIQEFRRFLVLWKDADPDLPEVRDAHERLAELEAGRLSGSDRYQDPPSTPS